METRSDIERTVTRLDIGNLLIQNTIFFSYLPAVVMNFSQL